MSDDFFKSLPAATPPPATVTSDKPRVPRHRPLRPRQDLRSGFRYVPLTDIVDDNLRFDAFRAMAGASLTVIPGMGLCLGWDALHAWLKKSRDARSMAFVDSAPGAVLSREVLEHFAAATASMPVLRPAVIMKLPPKRPRRRSHVEFTLYDEKRLKVALDAATKKEQLERRHCLERLAAPGAIRRMPVVSMAVVRRVVAALGASFPNFQGVIEHFVDQLLLAHRARDAFAPQPMLVWGAPGVGKTEFCRQLAAALGGRFIKRSMPEVTAAFTFSGQSSGWAAAKVGDIALELSHTPTDNFVLVVMLDEIDKIATQSNYPPDGVLLSLLEPGSARQFRDESLDVELDASRIIFVATANCLDGIPAPLRSRLDKFEIKLPEAGQMPAVVRSVDAGLRARRPALSRVFRPLSGNVVASLAEMSPREVSRVLARAYAMAVRSATAARGRIELPVTLVHLAAEQLVQPTERPMGFM